MESKEERSRYVWWPVSCCQVRKLSTPYSTGNQEGKCDSSEMLHWLRTMNVRIWTRADLNTV